MDLIKQLYSRLVCLLNYVSPVGDLAIRLWVAKVFFASGLAKIQNWEGTIYLFENEYKVPLLPPLFAAYSGTATELIFPILLAIGLATRPTALVLFAFNIIAVMSYADLGEVGLKDHQHWGLLLLVPLLHGPGKLSIDYLLSKKFSKPTYQ